MGVAGREFKKEGIYVYMWLIHLDLQQELTQHWKVKTPIKKSDPFLLICLHTESFCKNR